MPEGDSTAGFDRRDLLAAGGTAVVLGLAAPGVARAARPTGAGAAAIPFYGGNQAGITTAQQPYLTFGAFRATAPTRTRLVDLLSTWTEAAATLCSGEPLAISKAAPGVPADTGETLGLGASRLTVTFGFGPGLFRARYGLSGARPAQLAPLPAFRGDALERARTGGDLCVQACADDPQVAFHAVRNLARLGAGAARLAWLQHGFLETPPAGRGTPRNLMGFHDGTANLDPRDAPRMGRNVWAGPESSSWMQGGSYLVARRIRIHIEEWDAEKLAEQQRVVGRLKATGAPIGGRGEFDPVVPSRLDPRSHVRLANPRTGPASEAERILRRGYNYVDGMDAHGRLDAGLFFIAFQRDPRRQFVPIQKRLSLHDRLGEYLQHTGSALFACPPGPRPGETIGAALLA